MRAALLTWIVLVLLSPALGAVEPTAATDPFAAPFSSVRVAIDAGDDGDDDEGAEKVEIPPPPADNLALPDDIDPKLRADFEEALALYEDAKKHITDEDRRKDALRAMTRLKKKLPNGLAHYYLGILHQWDRDYKKARRVLEECADAHPEFYEVHVELGDVEVWEKKLDDAIPHYERALEVYPHFEYGVDRMLTVLVQLGRFEEAKVFLDRAMLRGPNPTRLQCANAVQFALEGPDWGEAGHTVESENYIVLTDVSEEFGRTISDTAELIRDLYDVMFPEIDKPDRKYLVIVFKDRQGYLAAGAPPTSAGVYMSLSRRLMLYQNEQLEDTLMTLKHEGFHQYCHEYLENIPSWFNEGLADYFSASELVMNGKKRAMRIVPNKKRIDYLGRSIERPGGYPDLADLMNMSQREMYDVENGSKKMYLHYCMAWSICYFCIESKNARYQSALKNYFKALRKGKTGTEAYVSTFGKLNMKKFQEQWRTYMLATWRAGEKI